MVYPSLRGYLQAQVPDRFSSFWVVFSPIWSPIEPFYLSVSDLLSSFICYLVKVLSDFCIRMPKKYTWDTMPIQLGVTGWNIMLSFIHVTARTIVYNFINPVLSKPYVNCYFCSVSQKAATAKADTSPLFEWQGAPHSSVRTIPVVCLQQKSPWRLKRFLAPL